MTRTEINFFQGLVAENIKDPGTTTTLEMKIPCRQQNRLGYLHIYELSISLPQIVSLSCHLAATKTPSQTRSLPS